MDDKQMQEMLRLARAEQIAIEQEIERLEASISQAREAFLRIEFIAYQNEKRIRQLNGGD